MRQAIRTSACPDFRRGRATRRDILKAGGVGLLGLHLPALLRAAEEHSGPPPRARAVIYLHQFGGPSHHDTFDPKPEATDQIRGEFQTVATSAPDIFITDRLPRMAQVADKVCLVRSLYHAMTAHNPATYYSLTGHAPPTDDVRFGEAPELFPAYGSVVDRLAPAEGGMPTFVAYPHQLRDGVVTPGQHASFLGKAHDPFLILQDPNTPDFCLPELSLPANLSLERLENRREILQMIDGQTRLMEFSAQAQGTDAYYEKALSMLASPKVNKAFDLSAEPPQLRDKYGRTTYGQGCLLARRLVEAGVKFVNVYFAQHIGGGGIDGWDTHGENNIPMYPVLKDYLLPLTDQVLPTFLEDLDARGLLDEVLVVWMGEFGRTPRINKMAGRDHWPQCYTALLAGAGVKRGFVYGSSDKIGGYPSRNPVRPDDLAATIFSLLGIDPHTEVYDQLDRPHPISKGEPITGLMS